MNETKRLSPLAKFLPWALLSAVVMGFATHSVAVGTGAWIVWWVAANVTHEICSAIREK